MEDSEILKILYERNPWWEGRELKVPEQKRRDFHYLKERLNDKLISAIVGPRRVGKSVLMQQLIAELLSQKIKPKNILFVELDEPKFETEHTLLIDKIMDIYSKNILQSNFQDLNEMAYVFLDEIQHVDKWSETLKSFYDRNYKIKFVVSGSSAAGITQGSSESLAGRIALHYVMTLKFIDYLKFRGVDGDIENIAFKLRYKFKDAIDEEKPELFLAALKKFSMGLVPKQDKIEMLLSEYLVKGGYVELLEMGDYPKCAQYLNDLVQLVIYKDIVKVFDIRNPKVMEDMLLYLASHSAEQISENSLSENLKTKIDTIGQYLDYLELTFLISTAPIYANNRAKQIRNPKKIFINDVGLRNMLNGTFNQKALQDSKDAGLMAETVAHNHLRRLVFFLDSYNAKCYYWKNGSEIDNVMVYSKKAIPIEVKYQNKINSEDADACTKFVVEEKSPFGMIITKDRLEYKNRIFYVPLWMFLLMC